MAKVKRDFCAKTRGLRITRLLKRDGDCCCVCGKKLDRHIKDSKDPNYITFDHWIPRSVGGSDSFENMRLAHNICNSYKGNLEDPNIENRPKGKNLKKIFDYIYSGEDDG